MSFSIEKDIKSQFKHIRKCCSKFYKKREDIELLESEVLEMIWRKRDKFKGDEIDFQKWSFVVTKFAFINNYRRTKNYTFSNIDYYSDNLSYSDDIYNKMYIDDILYTVEKKFKKIQSDIFKMHIVEGYKIVEVAKELKVPDGTVKSTVHIIRKYINNPENIISVA
jgi:RNA polymerase sigma factor (sigma-70 family)